MIRSRRIPAVLSRICGNGITGALLVTSEGELLGSTGSMSSSLETPPPPLEMSDVGALVTEFVGEYVRLGYDLAVLDPRMVVPASQHAKQQQSQQAAPQPPSTSVGGAPPAPLLHCLIAELDRAQVGVAHAGLDCVVVCLAETKVPHGRLKSRLQTLAWHLQEQLAVAGRF